MTEHDPNKYAAKTLAKILYEDNKDVLKDLFELFDIATEQNEQGIANFAAERIDMHNKWQWQLGSSLGKTDVTE